MKLRLDLLEHLTADDIRQAAEESVHRFKPEPNFSKTGAACAADWETLRQQALTLAETFDRLRAYHRRRAGPLAWKPDDSGAELTSLPESLIPDSRPQPQ